MRPLAKVVAIGSALSAAIVGLTVWGLDGPAEAYAIARIDGFEVVPLFPVYGTCYPPGFTNAKYRQVSSGDTPDAVRALLGEPLSIYWSFDDEERGYLWFEPVDGQWRTKYANKLDVPAGRPMSSLAALRSNVISETWGYSRSCIPDDSRRMRWVSFRRGRMDGRGSGIYYD